RSGVVGIWRDRHVVSRRMGGVCTLVRAGALGILLLAEYLWRERDPNRKDLIRCGACSGWVIASLLCANYGQPCSCVATLPGGVCVSDRRGTNSLRVGSAAIGLAKSGGADRDRHADSVRVFGMGSGQVGPFPLDHG